jgi:predicted transposase YbfD/YdcC
VDAKSNEITAIPQLIKLLDLEGATVTIDALRCQKDITQAITEQEADQVLALQENHKTLYDDVTLFFADAMATDVAGIDHERYEIVDGDHGRIETWRYWIMSDIAWLEAQGSWAQLQSIGMVKSRREVENTVTIDTRVFITSLPCDSVVFAQAVRQHWSIESSRHWVLDVSFEEDACRMRQDKGARNFPVLRHIALNLLRREGRHKWGIKARRKRAGWNTGYLLQILMG